MFVNGAEAGHTKGMTESPSEYQSPPFVVQLYPAASGPTVIAIRTWAGPATITHGLLRRVELGAANDMTERHAMAIGHQWNEYGRLPICWSRFCFSASLCWVDFSIWRSRHHPEYLWLALLCLSVAAGGAADSAFGLAIMPLSVYRIFTMFSGRIFIAITLEFVLHFTGTKSRKIRAWRADRGAGSAVSVFFLHLTLVYQILSVASEVLFCGLVMVLLFRAWRRDEARPA